MSVSSLAFIGNASAHDALCEDVTLSRGVFDKETRRKPLAFAADAAAMAIEGRFGTANPLAIPLVVPVSVRVSFQLGQQYGTTAWQACRRISEWWSLFFGVPLKTLS